MDKNLSIKNPFSELLKKLTQDIKDPHRIKEIHSKISKEFNQQQLPKATIQALLSLIVNDHNKQLFLNREIISYGRKIDEFVFDDGFHLKEIFINPLTDRSFLLNKLYCHEKKYTDLKNQISNKEIILSNARYKIENSIAIDRAHIKEFLIKDYFNENGVTTDSVSNLFSSSISDSYNQISDKKYRAILNYHKILTSKQIEFIFQHSKNRNLEKFIDEYKDSIIEIPHFSIKYTSKIFVPSKLLDNSKNVSTSSSNNPKRTIITRDVLEDYMTLPIKNKKDVIWLMADLEKRYKLPSNIRERNKYRAVIAGIVKKSLSCYVSGENIEQVVICGNSSEQEFTNGDTLSFDHLFPQCLNGVNSLINGMPMSSSANSKKSDQLSFESKYGLVTISPVSLYSSKMVKDYLELLFHQMGYSNKKIKNIFSEDLSTENIFMHSKGNDRKKALLEYSFFYREEELMAIESILGRLTFNKDQAIICLDNFKNIKNEKSFYGEYKLRDKKSVI